MKRILAALVLAVCGAGASAAGPGMDDFIAAELPASGAPGMAYAVIDNGEVTVQSHGEVRRGSGEAVTADTPFRIGSVTKSFTALAIMQLAEAGAVETGAPVSTYLPAFADGPRRAVTIRQLLNHTSGLSTVQGNSRHAAFDAAGGLVAYANGFAAQQPAYAPGTVFEYSNANYQVLGAVIEQASGQAYADYMAEHVFQPLGMAHTAVGGAGMDPPVATGHRPWFGGTRPFTAEGSDAPGAPAGGIVSSASDMARYMAMLLNGQDDILSAGGKAQLLQPSGGAAPFYGMGWYIDDDTVWHTGLVPGSESLLMLLPAQDKGVVVLVNSNSGFGFSENWTLRNGVALRALGLDPQEDETNRMQQATYLLVAALPLLFVMFAVIGWRARPALQAKRASRAGLFSLWFPLCAMAALAWVLVYLVPRLFGGSLAMLRLYQPDFALLMLAGALAGLAWALFRLALAYFDPRRSGPGVSPAP